MDSTAPSPFLPGTRIQYAIIGECWIPNLKPNAKGYCYIQPGGRAGKRVRLHRYIYEQVKGSVPDSLFVLHSCDNRACSNPEHLYAGTAKDNTDDMISKGRDRFVQPRTDHRYRNIIAELHRNGLGRFQIAERLGISPSTVWNYTSKKGPYYVGN